MNTAFSFQRVWDYMKWGVILNKKRYLYVMLIIPGIYLFNLLFQGIPILFFSNGLLLMVMTILPLALEPINEKEIDGKLVYTIPVSSFERFFCIWLKCVILFPLLTYAFYFLLNEIFIHLPFRQTVDISSTLQISYKALYYWIAIQSIVITASFSFQKNQWKTGLSFLLIVFFIFSFMQYFLNPDFGITVDSNSGSTRFIGFGREWSAGFITAMKYYMMLVFPLGMWTVSFLKIRELEI